MLTLREFTSPEAFANAALLFLLENEAEHCLPIGVLTQALESTAHWSGAITYVVVERDGMPVAASLRTPPYNPIVSRVTDDGAIPMLVDRYSRQPDVAGVLAPLEVGHRFARTWTERTGQRAEIAMSERIYKIEQVNPVVGVSGSLRSATTSDRELLLTWNQAFVVEAFGERAVQGQAERTVNNRLNGTQSGFAIWEDDGPVSLVAWGNPTPNGIGIGPVYTPAAHRGKGYASAATAAVSQRLIDDGRTFCALFADLDNPTSNGIYQRIGYEPVADIAVYRFIR